MPIIAKESGGEFVIAPEGTHIAICSGVIDLGTHAGEYMGKPRNRRMVRIVWELPDELLEGGGGEATPMTVAKHYTLSLSEKAALRHDLESWRGRAFTPEECAGFDIAKLAGVPCLLTVVHEKKADKTYANIKTVSKVPKGTAVKQPFSQVVVYSVDEGRNAIFKAFPEWLQKKIGECAEFNTAHPRQGDEHYEHSTRPDDEPGF